MKSPSSHWSSDLDQDFIDKVLVRQAGRPGALLGILQQVQNNHPRKFLPLGNARVHRSEDRHSLVQDFQRRHVLCAVQSRAAGSQHDLGLPRNGLPHQGVAGPVREGDDALRLSGSARWRAGPVVGHNCRWQHNLAHRCLLRSVRIGAGHRGQPCDFRSHERTRIAARIGSAGAAGAQNVTSIRDESSFRRGSQSRPGQASALAPAHCHRHGHLRDRQWSGGRLPCLR